MDVLTRIVALVGLLAWLVVGGGAEAQVGRAVAVVQNATAASGEASRTLRSGMRVTIGERIATDPSGRVQLKFSDDTRLVVGPGSSLVIDEYVLNPGRTVSKFTVSALGGTFRFISGNSPSNAYLIDTAVATIGVRGTGFDFAVEAARVGVTTMEGIVEVCRKIGAQLRGECFLLQRTCGLTYVEADQFDFVRDTARRNADWQLRFPFMLNQGGLLSEFQLPIYNCGHLNTQRVRIGTPDSDLPERGGPPPPPPPSPSDDEDPVIQ